METFLTHSSFGEKLRQRREEKQLTVEAVATHLRLKKALIYDIESGNYDAIPSAYLKGYLRSYAKFIALPEIETIDILKLSEPNSSNGWKPFSTQKQVTAGNKFIQWITLAIISALILLVALWWQSDNQLNNNMSFNDFETEQIAT